MIPAGRHGGRLATLLILVLAGLGGLLVLQLQEPAVTTAPAARERASVPPEAAGEEGYVDEGLEPLSAFAEIAERPLFNPTRRPQAPEAPVAAETIEEEDGDYVLRGLTSAPEGARALLLLRGARRQLWVSEGESLNGWLIERISPEGVVMVRAGKRQQLALRDQPDLRRKPRKSSRARAQSGRGASERTPAAEASAEAEPPAEPAKADEGGGNESEDERD